MITEEEAVNDSTLEETMNDNTQSTTVSTTSQLELKRSELRKEIERARETLSDSQMSFASIKLETEATQRILSELQTEADIRADVIKGLQAELDQAKAKLAEIQAKLNAASKKATHDTEQLQVAKAMMQEDQEYLEALREELESLDDFVVNLIDPNYDLTKGLPTTGRLISTVELDGVDVETPESDIDQLEFSRMLMISRKTGFKDILELGTAYEFAWLVVKCMLDSAYETHVITDDARILKLIDVLME